MKLLEIKDEKILQSVTEALLLLIKGTARLTLLGRGVEGQQKEEDTGMNDTFKMLKENSWHMHPKIPWKVSFKNEINATHL